MTASRVLVVEDEPRVADFLARGLRAEGYVVDVARDGRDALSKARGGGYAAMLLDLRLPRLSGREVCIAMRQAGDTTPIMMVTALDALEDRVDGLTIGADDYLAKPFAFDELLARLGALIRRSRVMAPAEPSTQRGRLLRVADIVFDRDAMAVSRGGRGIELTAKEMALLELLMAAPGRVFSRERILSHVWGVSEDPLTNVVDVYIRRLRRKLEEEAGGTPVIVTVRGHGYRIDGDDPAA
ncbi:response regulator transcription factor [Falsiroseomonas oryzae]|uniref:response regulator transcription factor n=1 Tax=Falsiroseomonas oryzae TaxID=2766473 RepID=UPI0022EA6B3A|nr:response regulator transcription factor [Roseomonas sp. MO-31]